MRSVNFNVYLDQAAAERLGRLAEKTGRPRNALIREAVDALLEMSRRKWPKAVLEFSGEPGATRFEAHRNELGQSLDDPFAAVASTASAAPAKRRRATSAGRKG